MDSAEKKTTDNNASLRDLVKASGLKDPVALTVFNRELGAKACTTDRWKAYLADPKDKRFVPLADELLEHAIRQFARLGGNDRSRLSERR